MSNFVYEFRTRRVRRSLAAEKLAPYGPLDNASIVAKLATHVTKGEAREVFLTIFLDIRNVLMGYEVIHIGTLTGVDVHPREVFRTAILASAAAIVVAHNHPSGDPTPSPDDLALTRRLHQVGELIGIPLIDHVIVAEENYHSIAEYEGLT